MRGKGRAADSGSGSGRITPAYAGKSLNEMNLAGGDWDHPRLCGEKFPRTSILPHCKGSPPPMRGKGDDIVHRSTRDRITPAYAGKSYLVLLLVDED